MMAHNKMYREIEGYEDAFYATTEAMDLVYEVLDDIRYGESKESIFLKIETAKKGLDRIKLEIKGAKK